MKIFVAVVAAVVVAVALTGCGASSGEASIELPDIELQSLDATTSLDLAATGAPRVLNLWATWCAPCRHELPALDRVAAEMAAAGSEVEIIGVNVGDAGPDAGQLLAELDIDTAAFGQVLDPTAQVQRALQISGLPATVFVDADGSVVEIHHGALTAEELGDLIDASFG